MERSNLLIVDDRPENLLVLESILECQDINIVKALSGNEALRLVMQYDFALILMDVQMPEMDGFETAELMRGSKKTRHIPIIFVTAISKEKKNIFKGYEAGAVDYLFKPVEPEILKSKVDVFLDLYKQKKELEQAKIQLQTAKEKAEKECKISEEANRKIMDSIQYATIIQKSMLPNLDEIRYYLPDSFFLWQPRDIVGGDIFHAEYLDDGIVIAVIDCTGHGVPGAFMTMIASSAMRRITRTEKCHDPAEILKWLNFIIKTSLQQDTEYALSDDGLDAAICFAKPQEKIITFAGAHLPLYYVYKNEINVIKGDRQSIGYKRSDLNFNYTNHSIKLEKNMCFYLASDGFADQLGGERELRFGTGRFRKLLLTTALNPFDRQKDMLLQAFYEYKGNHENVDDVTIAGFGFDTPGKKDRRKGIPDNRECFIERRRSRKNAELQIN
ncbi:Two component system response regulator, PPM-type phosphatase domain-containing protein [Desulfonema limicola]|uniref:Two component system response regulator, PPM-type phosphatase domain-containing protein n=1 Tax=Desulfonema limicola TaxID=45656 RepID=A0A975GG97_9BACT|nr:response regulator [Desulfonema limicola]QTA80054.1 Two component system response regulator, PPM-type phosphatase domain-containing protein [Desulfonema limicola]